MQPTFFDYAVVFILLASGVLGVLRGLVREVLSLIGWVVAFWVAFRYGAVAAGWMPESMPGGELARHALGFVVLLIGTVLGALGGRHGGRAVAGEHRAQARRPRAGTGVRRAARRAAGDGDGHAGQPDEIAGRTVLARRGEPPLCDAGHGIREAMLPPELAKYVKT